MAQGSRPFEVVGTAQIEDLKTKNDLAAFLLYFGTLAAGELKVKFLAMDKEKDFCDVGFFWVDVSKPENANFLKEVRYERSPEVIIFKKMADRITKDLRPTMVFHLMSHQEEKALSIETVKEAILSYLKADKEKK